MMNAVRRTSPMIHKDGQAFSRNSSMPICPDSSSMYCSIWETESLMSFEVFQSAQR